MKISRITTLKGFLSGHKDANPRVNFQNTIIPKSIMQSSQSIPEYRSLKRNPITRSDPKRGLTRTERIAQDSSKKKVLCRDAEPQNSQRRAFSKTMTNILKETSDYLRIETQYFASQNGFIFRGVPHADADVSATNDENILLFSGSLYLKSHPVNPVYRCQISGFFILVRGLILFILVEYSDFWLFFLASGSIFRGVLHASTSAGATNDERHTLFRQSLSEIPSSLSCKSMLIFLFLSFIFRGVFHESTADAISNKHSRGRLSEYIEDTERISRERSLKVFFADLTILLCVKQSLTVSQFPVHSQVSRCQIPGFCILTPQGNSIFQGVFSKE